VSPAKILLVDDHQILREGLRLVLQAEPGFEVVGEAGDTDTAWEAVNRLKPDFVILDLDLPGVGGAAFAVRLREQRPAIKIVIFTGRADPQFVDRTLSCGVQGYVLKTGAASQLVAALHAGLAGQTYLSPEISTLVVNRYRQKIETSDSAGRVLSARQLEVLKLIAEGQTTKEIAFALGLSTKTIESHRLQLLEKLGVTSVAQLTKYALREGLTTS